MQCTGQLMSMHQAQLAAANRQLSIGVRLISVNQHTARAVHGFYGIVHLINLGEVHVFFVMIPVTAGLPQLTVQNHRSHDFRVAITFMNFTPVIN